MGHEKQERRQEETPSTIKSFRRLDDSAILVNKILGGNKGAECIHCGVFQYIFGHAEDCLLFKVRPEVLLDEKDSNRKLQKKNANKKILFYNDKRYTNSKQRINRKPSTKPGRSRLAGGTNGSGGGAAHRGIG